MLETKFKRVHPKTNTIFRGDNLEIMRAMPSQHVDLIYIDPPFFTQRDYKNIWGDPESVSDFEKNFFDGFRDTKDFFERHIQSDAKGLKAYLEWMRARLIECHRILKPTGSLFVHLDYHAVHYVKVILDEIFGYSNFRNEIIWQRKTGRGETNHKATRLGVATDTILFYSKTKDAYFETVYSNDDESYQAYVDKFFRFSDENGRKYRIDNLASPSPRPNLIYEYKGYKPPKNGWAISKEKMILWDNEGRLHFPKDKNGRIQRRRYLDELKGKPIQNLWDDIPPVSSHSKEHQGWPTQKPVALLERIITSASKEGDIIFDCFAGCGTSMHAAHNLKRKWIGIDISPTAIKVNKKRLEELGAKVEIVDENELDVVLGQPKQKPKHKAA